MSARSHARANPLSTKKRTTRNLQGPLPESLMLNVASFFVAPHKMHWNELLAMRAVNVSWNAVAFSSEAAPVLWTRLIRPPHDAALALGARGAGKDGPAVVDLQAALSLNPAVNETCGVTSAGLEALHGIRKLRLLNVRGPRRSYALSTTTQQSTISLDSVDRLLFSLAAPHGSKYHTPLHLMTDNDETWKACQLREDNWAAACRRSLTEKCDTCAADMNERFHGFQHCCDMCERQCCWKCDLILECDNCGSNCCMQCSKDKAPGKGWGLMMCDACMKAQCVDCNDMDMCADCGKHVCCSCEHMLFCEYCEESRCSTCEPCDCGYES